MQLKCQDCCAKPAGFEMTICGYCSFLTLKTTRGNEKPSRVLPHGICFQALIPPIFFYTATKKAVWQVLGMKLYSNHINIFDPATLFCILWQIPCSISFCPPTGSESRKVTYSVFLHFLCGWDKERL